MFDDMIADMEVTKSNVVNELFSRGIKLNILLIFMSQSYFKMLKTIIINATLLYHENS